MRQTFTNLDSANVPHRYAEISLSSGVQAIGASIVFLVVLTLSAWGLASAVPNWFKGVLVVAIILAAMPVAFVILNYRKAVQGVASLIADMIEARKDRSAIEKLKLEAEIAELRATAGRVKIIEPIPVRAKTVRYEPEVQTELDRQMGGGVPMRMFYKDTDMDVRDLAYFVEQICIEGHTTRTWLKSPPRQMPSGLMLNEFDDYDQFIQALLVGNWILGRDRAKRLPGKLLTENADEIKKGLRLPPEFWGTDWRKQLPKEFWVE